MKRTRFSILTVLASCLWCPLFLLPVQAADTAAKPSTTQQQQWHALLQDMQRERELLKSGQFRARARVSFQQAQPVDERIRYQAECWFADRFRKIRFDQSVQQPLLRYEQPPRLLESNSTWIRTPELSIHTAGNGTSVRIFEPAQKPHGYYSPFDVRVLGLINNSELLHGISRAGERFFLPGVIQQLQEYRLQQIQQTDGGLTEVTLLLGKTHTFKLVLQIDRSQGYTPTSYRLFKQTGTPSAFAETPVVHSKLTWKEQSRVWVPVRYESVSRWNDQRVNLELDWLKINQAIPAATFTLDDLELPAGLRIDDGNGPSGIIETQVIDHRGGQKKLIRGGVFISDEERKEK